MNLVNATLSAVKGFISPRRYIQGPGVLEQTGKFVKIYGKKAFVFGGKRALGTVKGPLERSFKEHGITAHFEEFRKECSWEEINRLSKLVEELGAEIVIGCGGGKALDTAKAVAHKTGTAVVIVPTIASTDAPTSALSVIYTEPYPGEFLEYKFWPSNPDLVLIDTKVIAKAPARFLACGMGDASSKIFEGRAVIQSGKNNFVWTEYEPEFSAPLKSTAVAYELCKLTFKFIKEYGALAMKAAKRGVVTPALEIVVEANTLLSGLAFENTGLAAAHSIHNGFTILESKMNPPQYHGELVAFGTIVELVLENAPPETIIDYMKWAHDVGLPINLEELGLASVSDEDLWKVAEKATAPGETIHNEPFEITPELIFNAIKAADEIGVKVAGQYPREEY